jgi:hypothetical protein
METTMLCFRLAVCAISILIFSNGALSQTESSKKERLTEAASFFRPYVYELTEPLFFYNWATAPVDEPALKQEFPARGEAALSHSKKIANRYWERAGKDFGSGYGSGLYLALDASSSREFGRTPNWLLMQVRLPVGFRFINLLKDSYVKVPLNIRQSFTSLGCPVEWESSPKFLDTLLANKKGVLVSCVEAIHDLFQTRLQIDGFVYQYASAQFLECPQPFRYQAHEVPIDYSLFGKGKFPERNAAFVVTSDRVFDDESVRLYNSLSRDDRENRVRLMSMLYKSSRDDLLNHQGHSELAGVETEQSFVRWLLKHDPKFEIGHDGVQTEVCRGRKLQQDGSYFICPKVFKIGTHESRAKILSAWPIIEAPPYPLVMSSRQFPYEFDKMATFLWSDLEGLTTDENLGSWVKENLFGCSDHVQYRAAN